MSWRLALVLLTAGLSGNRVPHMRADYPIKPVPFTRVQVRGGFWGSRLDINRTVTIPLAFRHCEQTGRIDNFVKAAGKMPGPFRGIHFDDSDVYKVLEGASYSLAVQPDEKLEQYLDELIAKIAAAQEPDGYLYTARTIDPDNPPEAAGPARWVNLKDSHELYNVGHLYEAAVAHFQATGKRTLLDVAIKNAELLVKTFGPHGRHEVPGHQEVEIGLAKLYRVTGEPRYLELAKFFLEQRGKPEGHTLYGKYYQDHLPVLEQHEAVGHAVRAQYMYAGMADVAALTGDNAYLEPLDLVWQNVVAKKLAITGGVGARHGGESFGDDYELPNKEAYNETCAAIANALWNYRMFLLHGDARYLDVVERVLYNGFLAGISLAGDRFFYPNPLASEGGYRRSAWFACACCPSNVTRFLPSIPGFVYATRGRSVYVNLFLPSVARFEVGQDTVAIEQITAYPWDGDVALKVHVPHAMGFALHVRVPGWARGKPVPSDLYSYLDETPSALRINVNGHPWPFQMQGGFAVIDRTWAQGDSVEFKIAMPVRRVVAHPRVLHDAGLVALERGPVVYCFEEVDNNADVFSLVLPDSATLESYYRPELLGGVVVVLAQGLRKTPDGVEQHALTGVPYYAWANREDGTMSVWLRRD
ncbi:MAG: glycoside hydrolase family 127 protein [candidate division KSB1 bacterium]|nr:glycoside hydrolase family 127 protein [candidate division KSB1 bacterium]